MFSLKDLTYNLPRELIAQYPSEKRDACKLLVYDRPARKLTHSFFDRIKGFLNSGDVLVLNTTKVWKARLWGKRKSGGKVEVLVLNRVLPQTYEVLLKPSGRIKNGEIIYLGNHDQPEEARILKSRQGTFINLNDRAFERFKTDSQAEVPLPPYIKRSPQNSDEDNYQTVYAVQEGSIAAPTAGFHFTRPLIAALEKHGIKILKIVLHIGYGTFRPIGTENIKAHRMHAEFVTLDRETAAGINAARRRKKRIIAVGTSATRALESAYSLELDAVIPFSGFSELFITPGYRFKVAQALITNFHLPKTTLFALVCAFAGTKTAHRLYQEAIDQKYRFYSYGDAMLLV